MYIAYDTRPSRSALTLHRHRHRHRMQPMRQCLLAYGSIQARCRSSCSMPYSGPVSKRTGAYPYIL